MQIHTLFHMCNSFGDSTANDRGHVIRIGDKIIKEGGDNGGLQEADTFSFVIKHPNTADVSNRFSHAPSSCLSSLLSSHPSCML